MELCGSGRTRDLWLFGTKNGFTLLELMVVLLILA